MAKKKSIRDIREAQYLRAAMVHVEKTLRFNLERHYTIDEIADMHMIRKRWIRLACIESRNVKAVPHKGETHFQYDGTPPPTNPYATGIDPEKLRSKKK